MEMARGRPVEAELQALLSVEQAERMVATDPDNLFWLGQKCNAELWLADAQIALNKVQEAGRSLANVERALARLLVRDKTKIDWQVGMRGAFVNSMARLHVANPAATVGNLKAYVADTQRFIESGKKLRPAQLLPYAEAELRLGLLLAAHADREVARGHWRAVVEHLAPYEKDANFHLLTLLARARLALGETEAARALKDRIVASSYRHPNFAEFINEWERGSGSATTAKRSTS